jgi:RNA polymerase sigma factor (sigma-70 family)
VTENAPIIHVVDDDPSFRTAISRLLRAAGYEVRVYGSAGDFLLEPFSDGYGCVLLDVRMPGPSGLELHEAMARRGDTLPVIFLTGHGDIPQSVRAMRQGAADFLTKPVRRSELIPAIRQALARQETEAESTGRRKEVAERFAKLTPREKEVFELVVAGRLNKQIAALLGTSERTVKAHRARIMEKMQVDSVAGLVHADGWLRPRSRS